MSEFDDDTSRIFAEAAAEEAEAQADREEQAHILADALVAIQQQNIPVPAGISLSDVTVDHLRVDTWLAMQQDPTVSEDEIAFYGRLTYVVNAGAIVKDCDTEEFAQREVNDTATEMMADERLDVDAKIQWARVFKAVSGFSPLSSDRQQAEQQIEVFARARTERDEEHELTHALREGVESFLIQEFGHHDNFRTLAGLLVTFGKMSVLSAAQSKRVADDDFIIGCAQMIEQLSNEASVTHAAISSITAQVISKLNEAPVVIDYWLKGVREENNWGERRS